MKALVYRGKHRMELVNVPQPRLEPEEVLLKIQCVGICGTDLHIFNGGTDVRPGMIIGHEFSGRIVAVGRNVQRLRVGLRVVAEHVVNCQRCFFCLRGKPNLCVKAQILGLHRPGALSEFMAVPARLVYPLPPVVSDEEGALIEPLTIALYAANDAGFLLEKTVAVVGQGPIGLLLDQILTATGATVIGIDVLPQRLAFAEKKHWVRITFNSGRRNFLERFRKAFPLGVDVAFEVVGKSITADLCLELTRRDGRLYLLGVFEHPATLDLMKAVKKELNIFGSWTCSFSFPVALDLVAKKKVDLRSLITHRYDLQDGAKAFRESFDYAGRRMKTIIRVSP